MEEAVRRVLRESGALCLPGIAPLLASVAEAELGYDASSYSTARFLQIQSTPQFTYIAPSCASAPKLRLEWLDTQSLWMSERKLELRKKYSWTPPDEATLAIALLKIGHVPTLGEAVSHLTRSVHILHTRDPAVDVSFSDPEVPFSIFVSVARGKDTALRVAESIIHETMHLQLSLVERLVPLVRDNRALTYSPWKQELRPVSGIIHGLYVFRVIDEWLDHDEFRDAAFARQRKAEIAKDVNAVDISACWDNLTQDGQALLARIR